MTPAFTADQLAGVFIWRWRARDMTREVIGHLRPGTFMDRFSVDYKPGPSKGETIRIRLPSVEPRAWTQ